MPRTLRWIALTQILLGCSSSDAPTSSAPPASSATLSGKLAFPVVWTGAILAKPATSGKLSTSAIVASEATFTCSASALGGAAPSRFLLLGVTERAPGTFPVGGETGRIGAVTLFARGPTGGAEPVGSASGGTMNVTVATDARFAGTFDVTMLDADGVTKSQLSGSFDTSFCAQTK